MDQAKDFLGCVFDRENLNVAIMIARRFGKVELIGIDQATTTVVEISEQLKREGLGTVVKIFTDFMESRRPPGLMIDDLYSRPKMTIILCM